MNTIPLNATITKNGFKIKGHKYWCYYVTKKCLNCNNVTYQCRQNNSQHKDNCYCSRKCQSINRHKKVDIKGYEILKQKDTPEFTYLLGLIASDGYVMYPPKFAHYQCSIYSNDVDVLNSLVNHFGGFVKSSKNSKWVLNNIKFVEYLRDNGFVNKKSLVLDVGKWFNELQFDNQCSFIRGVFDGDGTICKNKRNEWRVAIISGSKHFLDMIKQFCSGGVIYKDRNAYSLQFNKNKDKLAFLDLIYDKKTLCLERKYNCYIQFKNEYQNII